MAGLDKDKLGKVLAMLASDHEGEALSAARRAQAMLRAAGKSWSDVLAPANADIPPDEWDIQRLEFLLYREITKRVAAVEEAAQWKAEAQRWKAEAVRMAATGPRGMAACRSQPGSNKAAAAIRRIDEGLERRMAALRRHGRLVDGDRRRLETLARCLAEFGDLTPLERAELDVLSRAANEPR
jgi:hypothetical protein